jgi:hypothetical protein
MPYDIGKTIEIVLVQLIFFSVCYFLYNWIERTSDFSDDPELRITALNWLRNCENLNKYALGCMKRLEGSVLVRQKPLRSVSSSATIARLTLSASNQASSAIVSYIV